jgi:hypothetical protein
VKPPTFHPIIVCLNKIRFDANRLVIVYDSLFMQAQNAIGIALIVIGFGKIRSQPDTLGKIL